MLIRFDESGRAYPLEDVPHRKNYLLWINKFAANEVDAVFDLIEEKIAGTDKFSVATLFGGDWDGPLFNVYKTANCDHREAGLLLGRMVLDTVIRDSKKWYSVKTNLNGRDLETVFYWRN